MDYRGVVAAALVLGAGLMGLTLSCSAPDPGQVTFAERPHQGVESSSGTTSGGSTSSSGVTPPGTDGGSSSGGTIDAFTGAAAYVKGAANGDSSNTSHNIAPINNNNPAGNDCMTCHKIGGAAAGNPWVFGGTVYTTKGGNTAAPAGVEVRIVSATGTELASTYTDAQGNFWIDQLKDNSLTIPAGAKVGIRDGASQQPMLTVLAAGQGGCQSTGCHVPGAGATGHIGLN